MHQLKVLRLYFAQSARARRTRFWHHLSAPALGSHLLRAAHRFGIQQAVLQNTKSGYLPGQKLRQNHIESSHPELPLCLELLDREDRLRAFLDSHSEELTHVRAVLLDAQVLLE